MSDAEVLPFNGESLERILGALEEDTPTTDLVACEICSTIPECTSVLDIPSREYSSGSYPSAASRLVDIVDDVDVLAIRRCPICGRFYSDEHHYEFLIGGSEDEYILTRVDRSRAIEMMLERHGKHLKRSDGKWVLI